MLINYLYPRNKFFKLALIGLLLAAGNALAEIGDYSSSETFINYFKPRPANNPINEQDKVALPFHIQAANSKFKDGFMPGLYNVWQEITLDPKSGASCGDGSPYKFWVKRRAHTSNILTILEGGGACWNYTSCKNDMLKGITQNLFKPVGQKDRLAFFSASTLKQNSVFASLVRSIASVLTADFAPNYKNKTQKWSKIYLPYCTGDVHLGFRTHIYTDPNDASKHLTVHHKGAINMLQVGAWVRNNLEAPAQFMLTGQSAGGVGANGLYFAARKLFNQAQKSYMVNDGGPIWFADTRGSVADNPSKPLFDTTLKIWGMAKKMDLADGTSRTPLQWYQSELPNHFDPSNIGTLSNAVALKYPNDRLGLMTFQEDYIFSSFIYRRFLAGANDPDHKVRRANTLRYWQQDLNRFTQEITASNYGYYLPATRDALLAHTLTFKVDKTTDIQELKLTLNDFMHNVTNGQGAVMRAQEQDFEADRKQFDLMGKITKWLFGHKGAGI